MYYLSLKIPSNDPSGTVNLQVPNGVPTGGLEPGGAGQKVISLGLQIVFIIVILLTLGNLLLAGYQFITSEGDKTAIESARLRLIFAILGLVVVFVALFVVYALGSFFGVDLLQQRNTFTPCLPGSQC